MQQWPSSAPNKGWGSQKEQQKPAMSLAGTAAPPAPAAAVVSESKPMLSWLDDPTETIMLFGVQKVGKTFAYCSYVESILKSGGHVWVVSTDKGFIRTAKAYFGDKIAEIFGTSLHYTEAHDIDEIFAACNAAKLTKQDLLVFDLLSDAWSWCQNDFVVKVSHGKLSEYVMGAAMDPKKIGLLYGTSWQYIKALHKFVEDIVTRKPCNFIGVCTEKDTAPELAIAGETAKKQLQKIGFDGFEARPGGHKELPYKFETIVRIGRRDGQYLMQVLGDRGHQTDRAAVAYGRNLKDAVEKWRREH